MSGPATSAAAARSTSKFQSKWALVIAGVKDLSRPAEKLSVPQNLALAATGFIWVRYSLVITPVNYSLAAVNFCVGATGLGQLYRIWDHQRNHPVQAEVKDKIAAVTA
ncbi:hypothetical protein QFC21_007290 [Naganishia friedmannii]|uniref:Uncharacterized protein n=1 Tax=Naganishia friedmannii TaxID=89922 RepID=A0ACC2UWS7_9TREE|nr:hypothetical protein QFC21_007290 [Naganishia friedmannii]